MKYTSTMSDSASTLVDLRLLSKRSTELDVSYYVKPNYNEYRRMRLMLLDSSISSAIKLRNIPNAKSLECKEIKEMIYHIEMGVYNYAYDMCIRNGHMPNWNDYRFRNIFDYGSYKVQSVIQKRPDIVNRILTNDIDPQKILYLSIHELLVEKSNVWDTENIRKQQTVTVKVTTDFQCPRCDVRSAIQYEVQTRGADEESTSKFQCQSCGNKWTEND